MTAPRPAGLSVHPINRPPAPKSERAKDLDLGILSRELPRPRARPRPTPPPAPAAPTRPPRPSLRARLKRAAFRGSALAVGYALRGLRRLVLALFFPLALLYGLVAWGLARMAGAAAYRVAPGSTGAVLRRAPTPRRDPKSVAPLAVRRGRR